MDHEEVSNDQFLESYIKALFNKQDNNRDNINVLTQYFDLKYLQTLNVKVQLERGDTVNNALEYLDVNTLKQLKEKKYITILANNTRKYRPEDPVTLNLQIKNVNRISVNIYEINLERQQLEDKGQITDEIDLSFLAPTYTQVYENPITNPFQV